MEIAIPVATGGAPSVSFTEFGQTITYALVDAERIQSRDYETGQPKTWNDGSPRMESAITGIVVSGTAQVVAKDAQGEPVMGPDGKRTYRPVQPGETVRLYYKGDVEKAWFGAVAGKSVSVGMLVTDTHDAVKPPKNPQYSPTKLHSISLAPNGDAGLIAKAEQAAAERKAAAATAVSVPQGEPFPASDPGAF